ncbi:hypothetical protein JOE40_004164 [Arthrobacter sp. PvP102]|uniref:hypothetical protein n=1 Tax=unclassified Arthrobacter TaxID=235627 RepID=UPI001AE21B59|nr:MULTISPECIES: hypothetical protein [unclassified Arthrobacter]MBP1234521.1 hypothetical protein [Arthrobacter sp. PvP103]MBP1239655.1 hypothetical protein [Arthrobacter sp. PvP102]
MLKETRPSQWSDDELDALIDSYLGMLKLEISGASYNKRQNNLKLQETVKRSHASIEFKLCNLSAVLDGMGRRYIFGYKPRPHFQAALRDSVLRRLGEFPFTDDYDAEGDSALAEAVKLGGVAPSTVMNPGREPDDNFEPRNEGEYVNAEESECAYWDTLGELWDRTTGGSGVAAKPASEGQSQLPTAPRPAGVEEACDWFKSGLNSDSLPRFLFLVGGPGAGKSHATSEIVDGLDPIEPPEDGLAHRSYRYRAGGRELLLINDATIGSTEHRRNPLSKEIDASQRAGKHLVACVNRGILIDEATPITASPTHDHTAGQALVRWLAGDAASESNWNVQTDCDEPYLRAGHLFDGPDIVASVLVVFVDVCSLLERRPEVRITSGDNGGTIFEAEPYGIADFAKRTAMDVVTPASALFSKVTDLVSTSGFYGGSEHLVDPIKANIESLSSNRVRAGILTVVRGAELTSGQRMTFREIWGTVTRCILGDAPNQVARDELRGLITRLQPTEADSVLRFKDLQLLAGLRFSQAIFGGRNPVSVSFDPLSNPITKLTHFVDPMRDAIPGRFDQSWESGWATPLADSFAGPVTNGSPLESLEDDLDARDPFSEILTEFDRILDRAFVGAMRDPKIRDKDRYAFISWYGGYLGRLYALANGIPAFRPQVAAWTQAWYLSPNLPDELGFGLRTLLRPKRRPGDIESASLIPILASRTDPIVGVQSEPKLALKTGDVEMKTFRDSEALFLVLSEQGKEISRMPLDFALVREALACGHEHAGVTEMTDVTSPRLERFRAARLIPTQLNRANYRVVVGNSDFSMTVTGGY